MTHPGFTKGYCQFSGGGDIIITSNTVLLLIYNQSAEKEASLSPNNEAILTYTIEGEKADDLRCQLFANTILVCVTNFVDNLYQCNKKIILELEQISAYAVGCTGLGQVGFYKLEI